MGLQCSGSEEVGSARRRGTQVDPTDTGQLATEAEGWGAGAMGTVREITDAEVSL